MSSFKKLKKYAIILKEVKNQRGKLAMVKIDLITGFLGSGKTTFIKKYAKYLLDKETITGEEFMEIYEKNDADAN